MSTFYVLPSRPEVGERFAALLEALLPGLKWSSAGWADLADFLTIAAEQKPDVFVVHRDELADGVDLVQALVEEYGAEEGDDVVEVKLSPRAGDLTARRWRLSA